MYESGGDHLRAEFDRLQRILDRALADRDGESDGRAVTDRRLHAFAGGDGAAKPDTDAELAEMAATIEAELEATRDAGRTLPLDRLARLFDLSRAERDVLLVALAPEIDRTITRTYGEIADTGKPILPSIDLVETVLWDAGHDDEATLSRSTPLFEYDLVVRSSETENQPDGYSTLTVDQRIVEYLKGDDALDPKLSDIADVEHHETELSDLVFDDEAADRLAAMATRSAETPTIYHFAGEDGTGKDRLPGALTDAETPILRARAEDVLADEERLTRLVREATLRDAGIHLTAVEAVTGRDDETAAADEQAGDGPETDDSLDVGTLVERLDDAPGDVFLSHTDDWTPETVPEDHHLETCACPFPDHETRLAVWEEYDDEFADPDMAAHLATNFRLPQRDIRRAVKTARYLCRTGSEEGMDADDKRHDAADGLVAPVDGELTRDHLYSACKRYSASNLDALAEQLDPGYTWDDIALNDRQQTHLESLCGHLQYRGAVTSEWGFGEPGSRGDGVVALFYGESGTGKTMAAEVIANETGLDLYRVDLSQVINKYVGETESRLATLLDEAERSNAILLFDEADAIFGKRAEVKDATDRYANTEINFLLQRLESFDGILLLTTNKRSGIDSAFKRRIQHAIGFDKPQELIRRDLWRSAFPDEASVATEEFDYDFLGRITTTPALIRKVATYAAYIAATEAHDGRPLAHEQVDLSEVTITFDHVVRALQYAREAGGAGFQVDFGEYDEKRRRYESHGVDRDWREELRRANEQTTLGADTADEGSERRGDTEG